MVVCMYIVCIVTLNTKNHQSVRCPSNFGHNEPRFESCLRSTLGYSILRILKDDGGKYKKKKTFFGQMPERLLHRPWLSMRASFSACVWVCNCRSQEVGWEPMRLVLVQIGLLGINIEKDTLIWNPTQIVFMLWMGCIQMKFVDNYLNELFILPSKLHEMPNYANYFANAMFLHHPKGQIVHAMNCSNLQWTIKFHMANIVLVKKHWSLWSSFLYL